ncbi:MAG: hypothetical protein M1368_05015 [Thaumarchaeota archaeon]|nr:hypothetical protein [Nitrososphaerota archaeon]MDG6906584.1 hypothetical protein [Nitrososphaerota archaeon]
MPISQGLKAGLAAGVIYGLLIGILHLSFQAACSADQLAYISQQIALRNLQNVTAQEIYSADLVALPIYWGLGALILGVIYGITFGSIYSSIPGRDSRKKGLAISIPVFLIGFVMGLPGYGIACTPNFLSFLPLILSVPISFAFGYILGIFYDSFGRLVKEERAGEAERAESDTNKS